MAKIIDKFYYDNKRIRYMGESFSQHDDSDMKILCSLINSILTENAIKIQTMETQLTLIKNCLELEE